MPAACVNGRPSGALAAATHAARTGLFLAERALPTRIERVRYRTVPASGVGHAIASAGAGDGGESPARQSSAESGERSRGLATRAAGADAPERRRAWSAAVGSSAVVAGAATGVRSAETVVRAVTQPSTVLTTGSHEWQLVCSSIVWILILIDGKRHAACGMMPLVLPRGRRCTTMACFPRRLRACGAGRCNWHPAPHSL